MDITYFLREPFFAKHLLFFIFLFFLLIIFVVRLHKNFNPYEAFLWFAYDFMGIRLILEKIFPSNIKNKKEKPSSFILWLIGIYIALFGIASNRYENSVDIMETQTTGFFTQFSSSDETSKKYLLRRIAYIQNGVTPIKPELFVPYTVIQSFLFSEKNQLIVETMKGVIEDNKLKLKNVILNNSDLNNSDLSEAVLEGATMSMANLSYVNFKMANLSHVNFEGATLLDTDFSGAKLIFAKILKADLSSATFENADLTGASIEKCNISYATNFKNADISEAKLIELDLSLTEENSLTIEQLCTAKSLKGCKLNELQYELIKSQCPDLALTIKEKNNKIAPYMGQ